MSTAANTSTPPSFDPYDPLGLDASLSGHEIAVRDTVRAFCAEHVVPHVGQWFEDSAASKPDAFTAASAASRAVDPTATHAGELGGAASQKTLAKE